MKLPQTLLHPGLNRYTGTKCQNVYLKFAIRLAGEWGYRTYSTEWLLNNHLKSKFIWFSELLSLKLPVAVTNRAPVTLRNVSFVNVIGD